MGAQFVNIDRETPMLLPPDLRERVPEDSMVHFISGVCADTGYFREEAVRTVESSGSKPTVYCPIERQSHYRSVEDLEAKPEPLPASASVKEVMARRLATSEGRKKTRFARRRSSRPMAS